jgi:hypothetical protein
MVASQVKGKVDDAMMEHLDRLSGIATVDIVPLLPPNKATEMTAVNMYVDDKSIAKGSALNTRAISICHMVGKPTDVRGDVFVAKIQDDEAKDIFTRIDIGLKDLTSDAPWVKLAKTVNANAAVNANSAVMNSLLHTQAAISDVSAAMPPPPSGMCYGPGCFNKGVLKCSACKSSTYCSKSCQASHWKMHKPSCKKVGA